MIVLLSEGKNGFARPATFEDGQVYLRRPFRPGLPPAYVRFVRYDPCPAFVWVCEEDGRRVRCPRDDLFYSNGHLVH